MLRILITAVSVALCAVMLALAAVQRRDLAVLHEQEQRLQQQATESHEPAPQGTASVAGAPNQPHSPPVELLRLRGEVGLLERRKRQLASMLADSEHLRLELANPDARSTNLVTSSTGYIRKATAQFAGYGTPEATIQSLLWAVKNRDFTNVLAAFTPEVAEKLMRDAQQTADFWTGAAAIPGMRVVGKEENFDGEAALEVEIVPGLPAEKMRFQRMNGEWKMATH